MSYRKRTDQSHAPIRDGLRRAGIFVWDTSGSAHTLGGRGNPDLVTWSRHKGYMALWVKAPGGKLTETEQQRKAEDWPMLFVETVEEAIRVCG